MVNLSYAKGEDDGVEAALKVMTLSKSLAKFIKENSKVWPNFGKKDSHLYRAELMEKMSERNLSQEAKTMVYFFAAVIKNKARIIKAMETMPGDVKKEEWFYPVRDFYTISTEQYVTKAEKSGRFPVVNIPSTNPGLDVLFGLMIMPSGDRTVENLSFRTTFSQLNLDTDMQALAKKGYEHYWNNVVKGTKNDDKPEVPMMREDYYKNPESDKYNLLDVNLNQVKPENKSKGFTREELNSYIKSFSLDFSAKSSERI